MISKPRPRLNELMQQMGSTKLGRLLGVTRQRADQLLNPEKRRARKMVTGRLKRGTLVPPACCQVCGKAGPTTAHHDDYAKPLQLRWLCQPDHTAAHMLEHTDAK
jgi:hypothetical protein